MELNGATGTRRTPEVVAPTNRVNVAFPFSTIHVEEASRELAELVGIVSDLVMLLDESAPVPELDELRERVKALAAKVH
jgi:hypothetical protein